MIVESIIQQSEQTNAGRLQARRTAEQIVDTLDYQEALLLVDVGTCRRQPDPLTFQQKLDMRYSYGPTPQQKPTDNVAVNWLKRRST